MAEGNGNGVNKWTGLIATVIGAISIIGSMLAWIYNLQDRVTKMEVAQNEVETQFCAADTARNLMHANDLRNYAILYKHVMGNDYPVGNAYYPVICNRRARP